MRRIEHQQPRPRPHLVPQGIQVEGKRLAFQQGQRHRHRAAGDDLAFVDGKAGIGIEHLVALAVIGSGHDRILDEGLGAVGHGHMIRRHRDAPRTRKIIRHRAAQLRDARRCGVARMAGIHGSLGRVDDVAGCDEVGLADSEADDRTSLGDELVDLLQHHEGMLGSQALRALRNGWHPVISRFWE